MAGCKKCGAEFDGDFCPVCGAPAVKEPESAALDNGAERAAGKKCAKCGAELQEGTVFCPKCGARAAEEKPAAPAKIKCSNCGAEMDEGAAFCPKCGSRSSNYMKMSGAATVEDMYLADHVKGRNVAFRIGGALAVLIATVAAMGYILPVLFAVEDALAIMYILFGIYLIVAAGYSLVNLVMSVLSVKKGMPRKAYTNVAKSSGALAIMGIVACGFFYMGFANEFGIAFAQALAVVVCTALASVLGMVLSVAGIGGKYDFKKPPLSAKQKTSSAIVAAAAVLLSIILAIVPVAMGGGGASLDKAERIEVGMSRSEVTSIMGDPDKGDEKSSVWEWYSGKYAKLFREYNEMDGNADLSDLEKLLEMEEEMENTPHDTLTITFDSEGKVTKAEFISQTAEENPALLKDKSSAEQFSDNKAAKIQVKYKSVFEDGSWTKGVNSARYTSIEADTSTWEFSVTWKFYINDTVSFDMDDVVMKEGTFSGTLPKLRNAYNENFARQVLWEYNAGFAAQALQDASEEEIAAYKELAAEYQITPPAGL